MTITVKPDVVSRRVQNEEVLLDIATGSYFGLNEVGSRVWELIRKKQSESKIIETISSEYEVSSQKAKKDIQALLKSLKECELIEIGQS